MEALITPHSTEEPTATRPAYPTIAQSWGVLGWFLLLTLLLGVPLYLLLEKGVHAEKQVSTALLTIVVEGVLFLVVQCKARRTTLAFRLTGHELPWLYAVLPLLVVAQGILLLPLDLLHLPNWAENGFQNLVKDPRLALFTMCIVAPIFEEVVFRGLVLRGMLRNYHPWVAIAQSALIFGLIHMNPAQTVSAFFSGLLLGWLYYRTRSLRLCMTLHALLNLLAFVSLTTPWMQSQGSSQALFGSPVGYSLVLLASALVLGVILRQVQQATLLRITNYATDHKLFKA